MSGSQMASGPTEIDGADIDQDGDIDLVSMGDHGNPNIMCPEAGILKWMNNGKGSWSFQQSGDNFGYGGIAIGDVNNDNNLDIGFGIHHNYTASGLGSKILHVGLGDGSFNSFTDWSGGLASAGEDYGMFGCDFGDFTNDGWLDLGSCSFGAGMVTAYINNHDGTWKHSFPVTGGNCYGNCEAEFGDANNDGYLDFSLGSECGLVWLGDGKGGWTEKSPGSDTGEGQSFGDVNNDGCQDIAFIESTSRNSVVYKWTGSSWQNSSTGITTKNGGATDLADLNNDGNLDLAIGYYDYSGKKAGIDVYTGDGTGSWTLATSMALSEGFMTAFRIPGDLDHNGYLDIVSINTASGGNTPRAFLNDATPTALAVTQVIPRGGEKFYGGSTRFIEYAYASPGSAAGTVKLELSTTGNTGPWTTIVDNHPDGGRYQWTVPKTPSKNCYIKATVTVGGNSASGMNAKPFEIIGSSGPPPVIVQLNAPDGNENWTVATNHDITWSASGGTGTLTLKLDYSITGSGGAWVTVASGEANDGTYTWTIPDTPSTNCYVRATVTDSSSPPQSASDSSNGNFTIYKAGPPPPPQPVLSYVTISPLSASVIVGYTQAFSARTFLSDGTEITNATVSWTTTGGIGTVAPLSGNTTTFTATAAGTGTVAASATYQGKTVSNSSAVSTHNPPPPVRLKSVEISPKSISGTVGEKFSLNAKAYDNDHIEIASGVSYSWEVTGGVGTIAPPSDPSSSFTATTIGLGEVKVTATMNGTSVYNSTQVSIVDVAATLDSVEIIPPSVSGTVGNRVSLTARAYDNKGSELTTGVLFTWSIAGKKIASLDGTTGDSVALTLNSLGDTTVSVEASYGGMTRVANADVHIKEKPKPSEFPWWLVAVIAAIIMTLILLLLLAGRRKKKEPQKFAHSQYPFQPSGSGQQYQTNGYGQQPYYPQAYPAQPYSHHHGHTPVYENDRNTLHRTDKKADPLISGGF
jgi:hypothetical protein